MIRRLVNLAAALSLLVCLATVVLWVRSYFVGDRWLHSWFEDHGNWTHWVYYDLRIGRGSIGLNRLLQSGRAETYRQDITRVVARLSFHDRLPPEAPDFKFSRNDKRIWGFGWGHFAVQRTPATNRAEGWQIVAPLWCATLFSAALPGLWMMKRLRLRRWAAARRCLTCGYDLRATPERCPECGAVPAVK